MLLSFIVSVNEDVLCKFLGFVIGCKFVILVLFLGCVNVSVEDILNIFVLICIMELKLFLYFSCFE